MLSRKYIIAVFVFYIFFVTYLLHNFGPLPENPNTGFEELMYTNIRKSEIREILMNNPKMAVAVMKQLKHLHKSVFSTSDKTNMSQETTPLLEEDFYKSNVNEEHIGNIVAKRENVEYDVKKAGVPKSHKNEVREQPKQSLDNFNADQAVLKPPETPQGLGEMGVAVVLEGLSQKETAKKNQMEKLHAFNAYLSEKISLHRSLPDVREQRCKEPGRYSSHLPSTSVIICFYNEEWTVLLRTVHSVLDRTRPELLHEIILIDDFSSMEHLKRPLDEYMASYDKVKVIHTEERKGLVRARIVGAKSAGATIITYLDSHCEAAEGWAEPLIDTVHKNSKTAAVPTIEIINQETFHFLPIKCTELQVGGFDWAMGFTWHSVPAADNVGRHPCDNVKSPTMAGGLFSINKYFFEDIGYYDDKLKVWGGENLGLSFKIWTCGGRIEAVPCSHIGHIFRAVNPYAAASASEFGEFVGPNLDRIAETWLDNHKSIYYSQRRTRKQQYIDVSKELEIRKKLKCESFDWYLDTVYPEQFVPDKSWAWGEVSNIGFPKKCLDSLKDETNTPVGVYICHKLGGHQTNEIRHPLTHSCLAIHPVSHILMTVECEGAGNHAKWKFQHVNWEKIRRER